MSTAIHILILEDSPADAELILRELRQAGFAPSWQRVETEPDYLSQLHESFDIILADYILPQFNALRALQLLRASNLDIPFIVLTGSQNEEVAVECMKQGAADYLLKDRLARLGPAVLAAREAKQLRDDKRKAEAEREESAARFRRLAENAPDIIYRYRLFPTPGFEYVSPAAEIITGYTPEEHYADPELGVKIVHPDDREILRQWTLQQSTDEVLVLRWIHKDGSIIWTEIRSIVIYDEAGKPIAFEGIARDITQAKQAQEALHKSEARYRAIVEDQTELICRFLADGTLTFANNAYCRYFGLEEQDPIGQSFSQLIAGEEQQNILKTLNSLTPANPVSVLDHRVVVNGELRDLQWTHRALFDELGNFVEFQAVGRDITDRKRADETLQSAHEELETRVAQRTGELQELNERLQQEIEVRFQAQEALRQRFSQLQTLYQLADAVRRAAAIEEIYEAALNGIGHSLQTTCAGILLLEPDQGLRFKVWRGLSHDSCKACEEYFCLGSKQKTKRAILITDIASFQAPNFLPAQAVLLQAGIQALALIPLVFQGRLLGKFLLGYSQPHFFSDEEVQLAQTIANHIAFATERKRAEAALCDSEERFRRVFDEAPIGMALAGTDTRFFKVNRALCEMLGYTPAEMTALTVDNITHPEDIGKELLYVNRVMQREIDSFQIEKRYITKQQTVLWGHLTSTVMRDQSGEILYILRMVEDITERKRAEEALRASEERFRQLAENIREVFWITTADRNQYLYVSPAYEELWGLKPESLYEKPHSWLEALPLEDRERIRAIKAQEKLEEPLTVEYQIVQPDGSIRWICSRSFPIRNESGEVYRIAGVAEDITERKHFIAELSKALETEKELNELKSRFVYMVSHEFRNPLASIVMSVELLERYADRASTEKKNQYFRRIKSAVKQMIDLLENVLLIGRTEMGKLSFDPVPVDLEAFCRELVEDCQLRAGNIHTITFINHSSDASRNSLSLSANSLMPVSPVSNFLPCLDEKLLHQILSNLLSNAIKYSPQGGTVHLGLSYQRSEIIFEITDEGIGIPLEEQPYLFDSFHRATNVGKIPGTGLGLAIVKKAVDLHGGTITVHSEVGIGTTFTVRLPIRLPI
ncbi:MAG: PAS domain S-box protein [Microcoleus vaginatus WJT46-NPBG5]|jgi:PAS domain S-box-containing protein|nr:PAS domain S-box protein [Microcoleus vaginatus WJT46-NPBG5]